MKNIDTNLLTVIIPVYNEEEVIKKTHEKVVSVLGELASLDIEILYIDDGSVDNTLKILEVLRDNDTRVNIIEFSRNFGHQAAVSAGIDYAKGDVIAIIDADLQDPPEIIIEMLKKWSDGYDVVYGVRKNRKETIFKKTAYSLFYKIWKATANITVPADSGDFCVMDRRVVNEIKILPERNRFLRGLRAWVGFKQISHEYERHARIAGETKYPFLKLVKLGSDGIFNFSLLPLKLITIVGAISSFFAFLAMIFFILQRIVGFKIMGYGPADVPGYTSIVLIILQLGGLNMLFLGILGEYVGRLYEEVKQRPGYIIKNNKN